MILPPFKPENVTYAASYLTNSQVTWRLSYYFSDLHITYAFLKGRVQKESLKAFEKYWKENVAFLFSLPHLDWIFWPVIWKLYITWPDFDLKKYLLLLRTIGCTRSVGLMSNDCAEPFEIAFCNTMHIWLASQAFIHLRLSPESLHFQSSTGLFLFLVD